MDISGPSEFYTKCLWDKGPVVACNLHFYPSNPMNGEKSPSMFLQHQLFLPVVPHLQVLRGGKLQCLPNAMECHDVVQSCCGLLSGTITFQHVFVTFAFSRTHGRPRLFQCLALYLNVGTQPLRLHQKLVN